MQGFNSLENIARITIGEVEIDLRDDLKQTIWEKFVRYRPRTRWGAWLMARSARNDFFRDEMRFQRRKKAQASPTPDAMAGLFARLEIQDAARNRPKAFRRLLALLAPGGSRRMRSYYRHQLRR